MSSVLIRNGLVFDGSDRPPLKTDIFIRDAYVAKIGNFGKVQAETIIDATGSRITPGVIDVNTDSDHHLTLFTDPDQEDFLRQGVTTILGGNCGISLAPFYGEKTRDLIRDWNVATDVNINWKTTGELLAVLKKNKLGVNFGTLIGYNNLRTAFSKESEDLTERQLSSIGFSLQEGVWQGAFGVSFDEEITARRPMPNHEWNEILKAISGNKSIVSFHVFPGSDVASAVNEIIKRAKKFSLNIEINHFQPNFLFENEYEKAKNMIETASSEININFDVFPLTDTAVSIDKILPSWMGSLKGEGLVEAVSLASNKKRLLKDLARLEGEKIIIGQLPSPLRFLEGRSLREFSEYYGLRGSAEAILKLCELTAGRAILFTQTVSKSLLGDFIFSPLAIISSNGFSGNARKFKHERNTKTFIEFLKMAQEKDGITFEKAVAKITGMPAKKYGITGRGSIREGYFADIVIWKDNIPQYVIVNGEIALEGEVIKKRAGMPLYSQK